MHDNDSDDDDVSGDKEEKEKGPIKDGEEWDVYGVDSEEKVLQVYSSSLDQKWLFSRRFSTRCYEGIYRF